MFANDISALNLTEFKKIGYTLKCLGAGFWALRQDNFKQALTTIVMEVCFSTICHRKVSCLTLVLLNSVAYSTTSTGESGQSIVDKHLQRN